MATATENMPKPLVYLYIEVIRNLQETIDKMVEKYRYNALITSIVHPLQVVSPEEGANIKVLNKFTRSDCIMVGDTWCNRIISLMPSSINCDAEEEHVKQSSKIILKKYLNYAAHLSLGGMVMIGLKDGNSSNLAKTIFECNKTCQVLVEVPMVDPCTFGPDFSNDDEAEDTWTWWNNFRIASDYNLRTKVALIMSTDVPDRREILRWFGEPIHSIVLPVDIFLSNKCNYPVLSKCHQDVLGQFINKGCNIIIKASDCDPRLGIINEYMTYLVKNLGREEVVYGLEDYLEIPLQPLYDNLDSYTYEIFERDPVKYVKYQQAIELAMIDKIPENEINSKKLVIMVVGAGRGPLVRATLNASKNTRRQTKVYIIEKNPNAINTLAHMIDEIWTNADVELFSADMRFFDPPDKADIIVSELLGSFGDNELSPECLDGAQRHLKPDGISIPSKYTSFANPLMSQRLHNNVRTLDMTQCPRPAISYNTETLSVVSIRNAYHIAEPQAVFEFVHPNHDELINNERHKTLTFKSQMDCILHGFAGYFEATLYKDITISTHPITHTMGMYSWFSLYIPMTEPQLVVAGQKIVVDFWRKVSDVCAWYEWKTQSPQLSHIHNEGGRASVIKF